MIDEKEISTNYFEDVASQETKKFEVHPEIAAAAPQQPEETQPIPIAEPTPEPEIPVSKSNESHVRALRMARERAEKERDEMAQKLHDLMMRQQQLQQPSQDQSINPDDLVEWKYVSKEIKQLRDEIRSYQQVSNESAIENRLKAQYPDFDKVVTRENIEILRAEYPELAETISTSANLYTKGASAYTMLKKLGIAQDDSYNINREKEALKANSIKPRSTASISPQRSDSPLSKANAFANGLTDDLKKQLYKEMQDAMKNK